MLFALSKIGWLFAAPSRVLLILGLLGLALGRRGRGLAAAALVLLAVFAVVPVGGFALAQLEATFPPLDPAARIDGILVIGGALDPRDFDARPGSGFNPAFGRLYEAARLARLHPEAPVFAIGGPTPPDPRQRAEADAAADVLVALGVARERILIERASRNTYENARYAVPLAAPRPQVRFALITSAFHMPRAMGCFRAAGFSVVADPVDYHWLGEVRLGFDVGGGWEALDQAAHEYFGLVSYWAMGRTQAVWPGP